MRTRNADNPKSPPPPKRTLPARKSASKTPPVTTAQSTSDVTVTPKRTRGKAVATNDAIAATPETPVEEVKVTSPGAKRTVKRVVKKTVRKKTKSTQTAEVKDEEDESEVVAEKETLEEVKVQEVSPNDVGVSVKDEKDEELSPNDVSVSEKEDKDEETSLNDGKDVELVKDGNDEELSPNDGKDVMCVKDDKDEEMSLNDGKNVVSVKDDMDVVEGEDTLKDVEDGSDGVQTAAENFEVVDVVKSVEDQEPEVGEKENMETEEKSLEIQEPKLEKEEVVGKETKDTNDEEPFEIEEPGTDVEKVEPDVEELVESQEVTVGNEKRVEVEQVSAEIDEGKVELENQPVDMDSDFNDELKGEEERVCLSDEEKDKDMGNDDEDDLSDEKLVEHSGVRFQEEHEEVAAVAEERRIRKEFEVFVGGLDRDATEEDISKVFQNAGEVVEVRMHKELQSNKNKGYAFVRFSKKEEVARALAEMKNPVIRGKRCGTAPSEDNDTLFIGNICNTWTKEAIRQKLKDYGVEGVETITLVADPQHEGLSRGFAFLDFSSHPDAMLAYKRLQKPDVIFGHPDRTVKVAFAEPLREPDPNVMAQVKTVFVDGLPPHWDEDIVRDHVKGYGSIERVMLARNMSTAKRKDFGFIDFTTHEAALTCIDGINTRELGDEKMKVRARLSNPLPKTQSVKGGTVGGFKIGQGSGATFPRAGRSFGRGALPSNRVNFQQGRGFYQPGHGQTSRMDYQPAGPHPPFRGRHNFGSPGGRWDNFRGPHQQPSGQGTVPFRYDVERPRHGAHMNRDHSMGTRGQPYMPDEGFNRPYSGRHYEDPYNYGDTARGVKRPYFAEQGSDYTESSRRRPRLDYPDPALLAPGNRFRGGGSGGPSRDYYNYDYSSYYGGERPYGNDRPYVADRSYGGDRPYGGAPPYGGGRSYGGEGLYGGDRPYGGEQSYGGRYHY